MMHIGVLICTAALAENIHVCVPSCIDLFVRASMFAVSKGVCTCVFIYEMNAGIGGDKSMC